MWTLGLLSPSSSATCSFQNEKKSPLWCRVISSLDKCPSQKPTVALTGWLSWLECGPVHPKVAGSIPSPSACGRQLIDVSLSLSPFLSPSFKSVNMSSGEDLKKHQCEGLVQNSVFPVSPPGLKSEPPDETSIFLDCRTQVLAAGPLGGPPGRCSCRSRPPLSECSLFHRVFSCLWRGRVDDGKPARRESARQTTRVQAQGSSQGLCPRP